MKKFCLYGGKKIVKPEIWNITSVELSSDYTSAIIQAESKTNGFETYDSYADFDLVTALVRSFHDTDMQQWQAVKDAANQLTGVTDWTLDNSTKSVSYSPPSLDPTTADPTSKFTYRRIGGYATLCDRNYNVKNYESLEEDALSCYLSHGRVGSVTYVRSVDGLIEVRIDGSNRYYNALYEETQNPNYDPNYVSLAPSSSLPYEKLAEKIVSNASAEDQGVSLSAETYVETVAQSIFVSNESKQFVKLSDLISQFELNKTLRT